MSLDRRTFLFGSVAIPAAALSTAGQGNQNDPLGVRADFPITQTDIVFLNTAYSAPLPRQVIVAGREAVERHALKPDQPESELGQEIRERFARLIKAGAGEIAITHSTAEAENLVVRGLGLQPGDNVVMSSLNYDNTFILYRALERELGIQLRIVPHREGRVEARDMEPYVDKRTRLVTVALVSHQNGYVHDLGALAKLAHAQGAYLFADATQAAGAVEIDVKQSNVDFLGSNSYKWLLGTYGVCPLYIKRELIERLRLDRFGEGQISERLPNRQYEFHHDARRFEYSSLTQVPAVQLVAGLKLLEQVGTARIQTYIASLGLRLQRELIGQGHRLFTPEGNRSPIVAFYIEQSPDSAKASFAAANIRATARDGTVRLSPALFNNEADVQRCLEVTRKLA